MLTLPEFIAGVALIVLVVAVIVQDFKEDLLDDD